MVAALRCESQCWPLRPIVPIPVLGGLLVIAGVIFSLVMLIDCLKRKPSEFAHPLTRDAEYDKLIWAAGIFLSLSLYYVGAIAYFFVVKMAKPEKTESQD